MWSVSPAEMVTIALVALIVFGPKRLPEIARRAGRIARDLRNAASDLRADIEAEYGDTLEPLEDARREMRTTMRSLGKDLAPPAGSNATPSAPPPGSTEPNEPALDDENGS